MKKENQLSMEEEKEVTPLFKNRTFLFFLFSIIFTSLTTPMYMLAEGWFVVDHLDMSSMLGIVLMVTAIPRLLFMSLGGVLSDRFPKSKIMFLSDFIRFLILTAMAILAAFDLLTFGLLLMFAACFGILEAFYWPAAAAIIPSVVPASQLRTANSMNAIIQQLGMFVGPAFAGMLIAFGSFELTFFILGVLLLLGAICLFFVREPLMARPNLGAKASMLSEIKEGFLYVKNDSFKASLILTAAIASFFVSGPVSVAFPTLVKDVFNGTALDLTYLQTSFALGSIAGGILIGIFAPKGNMAIWAYSAFVFLCIGIIALGASQVVLYAVIISIFTGIASSFANMLLLTVYQLSLEPDKLGRGMSIFTLASTGLYPISAGVVPIFLSNGISISQLLIFSGAIAATFLVIVLLRVKSIRSESVPLEQ